MNKWAWRLALVIWIVSYAALCRQNAKQRVLMQEATDLLIKQQLIIEEQSRFIDAVIQFHSQSDRTI